MGKARFFKAIEDRGWMVESADQDHCIAKCKTPGCSMRIRVRENGAIPMREVDHRYNLDRVIHTFDDARKTLRDRREGLGLSIVEIEEISGIGNDHLAKFERDNHELYPRMPNVETFIYWANTLGYEIVLRPSNLPMVTCKAIQDTRHLWPTRRKRTQKLRRRAVEPDREDRK